MHFPLRFHPETVSHFERQFWDALSARGFSRKRHPTLKRNSGTQFPVEGCSGKCVPFQARIPGRAFRLKLQPESASHSGAEIWDAASACGGAPNKRPRLAMELGPKAQHMQLVLSANSPSAMLSAPYPTRGDGRGCRAYPPWADLDVVCRQTRGRRSARRAPWGSLRSRRCPCRRMPRATARPSPRR